MPAIERKLRRGEAIPRSGCVRSFCPRCGGPVRVTKIRFKNGPPLWCVACDPPHKGCGNGESQFDDGEFDPDAYGCSLQHDYGDRKGI